MVLDDIITDAKRRLKKAQRELKKLPPDTRKALGMLGAKKVGDLANALYESRTPEGKELWEKLRPMHHGDAGYLVRENGRKKRDPFLEGIGEGLMISDAHDVDKCVYPGLEAAKTRKKRKNR